MFVSLSLNLCLTLPDDCHCRLGVNTKIVKGENSKHIVPWQVSVQSDEHMCSGIILDDETIVTIYSTCVSGYEAKELKVVAGILRLDEKNETNTYDVKSIILAQNDIESTSGPNNTAILKLTKKLNLEKGKIEKACIRMFDSDYKRFLNFAQHFMVTGFGFDQAFDIDEDGQMNVQPKPTNNLKMADIKIDYKKTTKHAIHVKSKWFHSDSVCLLDEGSPLMLQVNGQTKVVAFADDMIVSEKKKQKDKFEVCKGKGSFIKFSSIDDFIKKFNTTNMCLEYSN